MTSSKIQTKKNETVITTSDTSQMHKKYLVNNLFRTWPEQYVDSDTGEIIEVERSELVLERGTYLDVDQLAVIQFHLQAGDVKEFKQHYFIFDDDVRMVLENGVEIPEDESEEIKHAVYSFYSVEVNAKLGEDNEKYFRFLVYARDVDNAKMLIDKFLRGKVKETPYGQLQLFVDVLAAEALLQINVISATKVKCHSVIGLEFTEAYNTKQEEPVEEEAIDLDLE